VTKALRAQGCVLAQCDTLGSKIALKQAHFDAIDWTTTR